MGPGSEFCKQKFSSKDKLKDHMDSHTDSKRHICTTCGHTFRYQNNLSRQENMIEILRIVMIIVILQ